MTASRFKYFWYFNLLLSPFWLHVRPFNKLFFWHDDTIADFYAWEIFSVHQLVCSCWRYSKHFADWLCIEKQRQFVIRIVNGLFHFLPPVIFSQRYAVYVTNCGLTYVVLFLKSNTPFPPVYEFLGKTKRPYLTFGYGYKNKVDKIFARFQ